MAFPKIGFISIFLLSNIAEAQEPKLVLPLGHTGNISSASFSPDGKKILTASDDYSVKLWDANSGTLLANLLGHTRDITSASFSPDGKKIITASKYEAVKIWDATTGNLLATLALKNYLVSSAEFNADGKKIITAGLEINSKPVRIWDANTGNLLADLKLKDYSLLSAKWSPDDKKIVTVATDSVARILDAVTGTVLVNLVKANSAQFSPDGNKLATVSENSIVKIWEVKTGQLLFQIKANGDQFNTVHVQFSPDGRKVVIASEDSILKIWDIATRKQVINLKGHSYGINEAFFSPDGRRIVTASDDNTARIWDAGSGTQLANLTGHTASVNSARFSLDGKKILTASDDYSAKLWDASSGKSLADLKGHTYWISDARFTPDGKRIHVTSENSIKQWNTLSGTPDLIISEQHSEIKSGELSADGKKIMVAYADSFKIVDVATGRKTVYVSRDNFSINSARFSDDGKKILTTFDSTIATIWNAETGKPIANLKVTKELFNEGKFSPDGKQVIIHSVFGDNFSRNYDAISGKLLYKIAGDIAEFSPDGKTILTTNFQSVDVWNASTGKPIGSFPLSCGLCSAKSIRFSSSGNKVAISVSLDSTVFIFDFQTGNSITALGHKAGINSICFSRDETKIVTGSTDGSARVWDVLTGKLLFILGGSGGSVEFVQFCPQDERILVVSADNTVSLWNASTGKLIFTNFSVDKSDYFIQSSQGYYLTTPPAAKLLHYVTKDLKVITFEQLDVKYNRPDKVLEAIGNTDTALIKSYRKAWEKRIKKLGIDTIAFKEGYNVPEADFVNREEIEYEQENRMLQLHIKGADSTYKLDRFNIWVNEVPVFGQRGVSIKRKEANILDTIITIKLSQGENRIETSISNVNGNESYRMPLQVNYKPAVKQKEMTRFIGIGVDQFIDSIHNLQYSTKDIRDVSVKLKEKYGNAIIIDTLFNENVTVSNVKALKQKLQQTTENDKVIIAYSGHGMLSKEYDYYLSTYAVNFAKPEENGLPYEELENLLDSIPARKKLMLIDACHSGEVDKEDLVRLNIVSDSLIKGVTPVAYEGEGHLGLKNSFELMQSLFVNVGKSTGATIISAAAGTQFALERNDLKNGVFTYCILEAMKTNATMKVSELKGIVGKRVEALTNGLQKPTSRNEAIAVDWNIW